MSKTQTIRDALAAGPVAFKKLHETVGGTDKQLGDLLMYLRGKGEVKIGTDDEKTITLKRRATPPQGKKPAKKAGKRAGRKAVKTYRDLADKHANGNGSRGVNGYNKIALDNLVGAGALLRQAIEDGVEGLDDNHSLRQAIANQERAEKLLQAAGG